MKPRVYNSIILAALLCQQVGYFIGGEAWGDFNGATHFILWTIPFLNLQKSNADLRKNYWSKTLTMYGLVAASNQMIDEWFIDPYTAGLNEYIILGGLCLHALYSLWKHDRK